MTSELLAAVLDGDSFAELVQDAIQNVDPDEQLRAAAIAAVLIYLDADDDEREAIRDEVEPVRRHLREVYPELGLKPDDDDVGGEDDAGS